MTNKRLSPSAKGQPQRPDHEGDDGQQRHGIDVCAVGFSGKGPKIEDQEASRYVQRPVREENNKSGTG
jgi:hypothetical protein